MEITRIIWLEDIVEKLHWKHNGDEHEVIEVNMVKVGVNIDL